MESPSSMGNTSSKRPFSIAILDYRSVGYQVTSATRHHSHVVHSEAEFLPRLLAYKRPGEKTEIQVSLRRLKRSVDLQDVPSDKPKV